MCTSAFIKRKDQPWDEAHTRGELRSALGVEPVYTEDFDPDDDDCLCCCDIKATAKLAGFKASDGEFGDIELTEQ